ncbi:MAG: hypothetical protein AAGA56_00720 [Myxococcota bacterium]
MNPYLSLREAEEVHPRTLIVEPNRVMRRMLAQVARRAHCEVTLREEAEAWFDPFHVIVLSSRCAAQGVRALLKTQPPAFSRGRLILVGRTHHVKWAPQCDRAFHIPDELRHLEVYLRDFVVPEQIEEVIELNSMAQA